MQNARRNLAGLSILILVLSFFSLTGCEFGYYRAGGGEYRTERHYYRRGNWYRRGASGPAVIVGELSLGAYIEALPPRHTTIVIERTPYYYDNRYYYQRRSGGGYVVVQAPEKGRSGGDRKSDDRRDRDGKRYND